MLRVSTVALALALAAMAHLAVTPAVSADGPGGLGTATGAVQGTAPPATQTITGVAHGGTGPAPPPSTSDVFLCK